MVGTQCQQSLCSVVFLCADPGAGGPGSAATPMSLPEDISVVFSTASWEGRADFSQADVHRQIAIVFKTPPYEDLEIAEPVTVNVFLQRLTDGVCSEPLPFTYLPRDHGNHGPPWHPSPGTRHLGDLSHSTCLLALGGGVGGSM